MANGCGEKKENVHQVGCHLISHSTQSVFRGLFGFQLAKGTERKIGLGNIAVKILFTVALLVCAQKVSSVCFHAQVLLII